MEKIIAQARERKLQALRGKLEKDISLRESTIVIGNLLRERIGYLPSFSQKEQSLMKKIISLHGWHNVLEALEFALTKPEVYFQYYGREVISFMSFYNNLPYILQNVPKGEKVSVFVPEYPPNEQPSLSPFMKGVLDKMKNILGENKKNNG